jgi:MFS family permease
MLEEHLEGQEAALRQKAGSSLWHNRDYLLLLSGQAISSVGTQLSQFAFPLLIFAITGSSAWAGAASGLVLVPYLILSLPAGALIDRWDRKRAMILCDIGRALVLASIPVALFFGRLTLVQLCIAALCEGTCYVFFDIAEVASIPQVVSRAQLPKATAQKGTVLNIAYTAGPLLGGTLFALGRAIPFLADAVSYMISVLSLRLIKCDFQAGRSEASGNLWVEIQQGLSWLWRKPLIRFLALMASVGNGIDNAILIFFIVVLSRQHASPAVIGLGYMLAGAAGVLGSYLSERVVKRVPFGVFTIVTQVATLCLLALYFIAQNIVGIILITTVLTFFSALQGMVQWAYRAALIPDELQGRVNSVFRLIAYASPPLFMAGVGVLLQVNTAVTVLVLTVIVGVVTVMAVLNTHVRHAPAFGSEEEAVC